jgi:membrane fusion protein (multidrug efflux system)
LPNTQSSSYLQNYNSYLSAQKNAEVSLQQSTVSEEQLNSQKAQVSQAEANLAVVQAQLAKTIIRAPFSGDIVSVSVSDGEYISVGQSAISLINKTGLFIQSFVGVDESKIIKVENEAIINKKFLATVTNIASGVNTTNGKVEIAITPNSTDDLLIIGEFVDVEIYTNRDSLSEAILIPLQAIKPRSDGSFVYVVNTEGILEETKVETGDIVGESIEIISGLPLSTTIANPVRGLRDGMKVKVKN